MDHVAEKAEKEAVRSFWNREACGEAAYAQGDTLPERLGAQARIRYDLEPYIKGFARFEEGGGRDVLEIGVGMGADHLEWARSHPRSLTGIDLTDRAIELTRERLALNRFASHLLVADAEHLPFDEASFDLVYSWGVLHHSPRPEQAIREVYRVLRPGGTARIMIYHRWSLVGAMLWTRYALLTGRPWKPMDDIYANQLESPGTKAYSTADAAKMLSRFSHVDIRTQLSFGDLLQGQAGQRHQGVLLSAARRLFPRRIAARTLSRFGLYLLIEARK